MRLLWIPDTRWSSPGAHRARYLIDCIKARHEVHLVTWSEPETAHPADFASPTIHFRALVPWDISEDNVILHHVPRWCFHRIPYLWRRNQRLLHDAVRRIVRENGIETIVFGSSAYLIGYPPTDTGAEMMFDYADYLPHEDLREYLERATMVTCASHFLREQVERLGHTAVYIPNAVDFERLSRADGSPVRERYGISDRPVISLIGLTCSPDLYFVNSLIRVHRTYPDFSFLFVGKGPLYRPLRAALRGLGSACHWVGWVPQESVYDYFLATDIGLYPGADNTYFRAACPIKLLEYSAARKLVVASPVKEVDHLNLSNVLQVSPTADGFYDGILRRRRTKPLTRTPENIPSWVNVSKELERALLDSPS